MDVGLIQRKSIGAFVASDQDKIPKLFTPLTIRGQTFPNRILVRIEKVHSVALDFISSRQLI